MFIVYSKLYFPVSLPTSEANSGHIQTFEIDLFEKIANN